MLATVAGGVVLAVWAGLRALDVRAAPARSRVRRSSGTARPRRRCWCRSRTPVTSAGGRRRIDGADASAKLRTTGKGLELELDNVADGAHRVHIEAHPSRVFGDSVDTTFTINVDTHKPTLVLNRVPPGWTPITEISGRVEPGAKLALSYEGRHVVVKPELGAFALDPDLPDGRTTVRLIASDRAGNRSVITRTMAVDGTPPRLPLDKVPALVGTAHPTLRGSLDDASPVVVQAKLDGVSVALRGPDGKALLGEGAVKGRFSLPLARLAQGVHRLSITAIDSAGNTSTAEAGPFTVDSTEKLRSSTSWASAPAARTSSSSSAGSRPSASTRGRSRASTTRAPRRPCAASRRSTTCP